jgi:apolipoprotein N-acyltransferase
MSAAPDAVGRRRGRTLGVLLVLLLCGGLQVLTLPPRAWWWLQPLLWVPPLFVLSRLTPGRAMLAGWLVGAAACFVGLYWVAELLETFAHLPPVLCFAALVGVSLLWGFHLGIFGWALGAIRRGSGAWWPVAVAAWFVACELLDPQFFPWFQGVGWLRMPRFFGVVSLAGVPAVSFFSLLCAALLTGGVEALLDRRRFRPEADAPGRALLRGGAVALVFVIVAVGWSSWRLALFDRLQEEAGVVRVALVQDNQGIDGRKELRRASKTAVTDDLAALSGEAASLDPDIDVFVWPEAALRGKPTLKRHRAARRLLRATGAELWTGASTRIRGEHGKLRYNSAYRLTAGGDLGPRYDKVLLLPFGEYDPMDRLLPTLKRSEKITWTSPGDGHVVQHTPHGRICFLICYEAIRRPFGRATRRAGAELLVNVTFDGWYGDTTCPHQHLALSLVRSAELGLPLVRGAGTGISAVADARGVELARTRLFERTVLVVDVPLATLPSVYAVLGDWFAWLCVLASALLIGLRPGPIAPTSRRRWIQLSAVWISCATVPLAWLADPYVLWPAWVCWGAVLVSLLAVAGLLGGRGRGRNEP